MFDTLLANNQIIQAEELKARLQREKEAAELAAKAKKEESSDDVRCDFDWLKVT
ncbi:hypothetical protein HW132_35510 [Brasilonema sp. CT11]|nr:hypothetical protein [Brasilonema sp. CT11]